MSEEEAVKKRWYVVQAYSQYESRVKKTLLEYIKMHNMEDYFGQVLVPTEEVVEMRAGQKRHFLLVCVTGAACRQKVETRCLDLQHKCALRTRGLLR